MMKRGGTCMRLGVSLAFVLAAYGTMGPVSAGRPSGGGTRGGGSTTGGGGRRAGNAPSSTAFAPADEAQAGFTSPVNNFGALTYQIPIPIQPGIDQMTPKLALVYTSGGGVGAAGVGWDLPLPAIALNTRDGVRPGEVAADVERYQPGEAVERYASNFGAVAVVRDQPLWADSTPTYVISPFNDQVVQPIPDEHSNPHVGADEAAWEVKLKDGTRYRYGFTDQASLFKNRGIPDQERKVVWYLDEVEDRHGNPMRYYYEEYPHQQALYRQPILRAIEYGIPARAPDQTQRLVVLFDYVEAPDWKRSSFALGTRVDTRYVLDRICTYANTHVFSTEVNGRLSWRVSDASGVEQTVPGPCTELTYDFEDTDYTAAYTSRPLLMKVQPVAPDGARLPPWEMTYEQQGRAWTDPYRDALAANGAPLALPPNLGLQRATRGLEQLATDVNGDGAVDFVAGTTVGSFDVQLGAMTDADGDSRLDAYGPGAAADWANPLRDNAEAATLAATMTTNFGETGNSDCWYNTDFHATWSATGDGLAYARSLTAAPPDFDSIFDSATDEAENQYVDLGGFQFLQSSFVGPMPAIGDESVLNSAETFDEVEKFGSYKSNAEEVAFDFRASDCRDRGDRWEIDHCWAIDGAADDGSLGAVLECLDLAGARYLSASIDPLYAKTRGYATGLWELNDLDGDGLLDLVFAAHLIQRDEDGMRNFAAGDNDWFWSRSTGAGWEPPARWTMPSKLGSDLGLPEVDRVHATGLLSTNVTASPVPPRAPWGATVSAGYGPQGPYVNAALVVGGYTVGIPSYENLRGDLKSIARTTALSAVDQAASYGLSYGAAAAGAPQLLSAATTLGGLTYSARGGMSAGDAVSALLPSIKFSVTTHGVTWWLPIVGDVLQYALEHDATQQHWVQGMVDLNGDRRPDHVSARWDAGATANPTSQWLFYRNAENGFADPEVWRFAQAPTTPSTPQYTPPRTGAISATETVNFTKVVFAFPNNNPTRGYGMVRETYGLTDLNGDGLDDFVDGNPYEIGGERGWYVHFNEGDRFGHPVFWPFAGDWDTVHGEPGCDMVLTAPRLSESVYGQPDLAYPNALVVGYGYSRQVQGLADIDRDGDPDYWYEEPYRTDEADAAVCSYTHLYNDEADFLESVAPRELRRRLLIRRNNGAGFDLPEQWVTENGYALSGGSVFMTHQGNSDPHEAETTVQITNGDFDVDGALDLAVETTDGWRSFALTAANPDVLSSLTVPTGGVVRATYRRYYEPGGGIGGPIWVVDRVTATDPTGTSATVERSFEYEHGVYDRIERAFLGFERVYEHSATGYTLSRYYQAKGYEGQLYCREVRIDGAAETSIPSTIRTHETAWASGTAPSGHRTANALGRPIAGTARPKASSAAHDANLVGSPNGPESDSGAIADATPAYGPQPPQPPVNLPGNEADEQTTDASEVNAWPDRGDRPPRDLSYGPQDVPYHSFDLPPLDSPIPGDEETPESHDGPPDDVWDLDFYGDCSTTGITIGDITFYCDPDEITDDMLVCGDSDDPGLPIEAQFYVLEENGTAGVPAPRLTITSDKLYNAAGVPRVTRTEIEYDDLGNVIEIVDLGGTAVGGDELTATTEHAALNAAEYLAGFPCHQTVVDAAGATVRESWTGYDGVVSGTCTAVTIGDITELRRGVAAGEDLVEQFLYNEEGMVRSYTDAKGYVTVSTYDPVHPWLKASETELVVAFDGPKLLTRLWTYYGNGVSPDQNFGMLYREVGYDGSITEHVYDGFDRPIATILPGDSPASPSHLIQYTDLDAGGQPLRPALVESLQRRAGGIYASALTSLDGWGRTARVAGTPPNNTTCAPPLMICDVVSGERSYDDDGRVIEAVLPYFDRPSPSPRPTVHTTYDLVGRITQVVGANGAVTRHAYDREFATTEDADGVVTVTEADARGKTRYTHAYVDAGATWYSTTETEHDPQGQLRRVVDPAGNEWSFDYDRLGRTIHEHDPNTGDVDLVYDGNGNILLVTDDRSAESGVVTRWLYDPLDRPTLRVVLTGATVNGSAVTGGTVVEMSVWAYDVDPGVLPDATITDCSDGWRGRLSRADTYHYDTGVEVLVSRKDYCYDDRGRALTEHRTVAGVLYPFAYSHNPDDSVATAVYPDGDALTYAYDAAGFLNRLTSADVGVIVDDVELDAAGVVIKRTLGAGTIAQQLCHSAGEGAQRLYRAITASPAALGRCDQPAVAGGPLHDVAYTYGASGSDRITGRVEAYQDPNAGWVERETTYAYDGRGRLASESYDDGATTTDTGFDNDTIGNLVDKGGVTQAYGTSSRSVRGAGPNALLGTSTGMIFAYDAVGNVQRINDGTNIYKLDHDARNRPLSVLKNNVVVGEYIYDEAGNRVWKISGGISTSYVGSYRVSTNRTETVYPGIGVKVNVGGIDTLHFTVSDPRGSTSLTVDATGAVTQAVEYEAYGRPRVESVSPGGYDSDFLFNGKEQEAAFDTLSVSDFGPRLYLGDVGRWLGPDPTFSDGANRYAYVRGDPVNLADPTGQGATEVAWLAWEIFGPGPEDAVIWAGGAVVSQLDSPAPGPADVAAVGGIATATVGVRGVRIGQRVYRHYDEIKVVADGIIGSARRLRSNLKQYYDMAGQHAHHIAAKALPDFTTARWVLDQVGIHVDDLANGMPVPPSMHNWELHFNEDYVDEVNNLLLDAYTRGRTEAARLRYVEEALEEIRQRVYSGQYHIPLE